MNMILNRRHKIQEISAKPENAKHVQNGVQIGT